MGNDRGQNAENEARNNDNPVVGLNVRPRRLRRRSVRFDNFADGGRIHRREHPRVQQPVRRARRGRPRRGENIQELGNERDRLADEDAVINQDQPILQMNDREYRNLNRGGLRFFLQDIPIIENAAHVQQDVEQEDIADFIAHHVEQGDVDRVIREEEIANNGIDPGLVVVRNVIPDDQGDDDTDEIYSDTMSVCSETPDDLFANDL